MYIQDEHRSLKLWQTIKWGFTLLLLAILFGCRPDIDKLTPPRSELSHIQYQHILRVGTLYSPRNFYYDQNDQPVGIDYELLKSYTDYLGIKLKMIPLYSQNDLFNALREKRVDLVAASIIPTPALQRQYRFSPVFYNVNSVLVYRLGSHPPSSLKEVTAPIGVTQGSYHDDVLHQLKKRYPHLKIKADAQIDDEELLREVEQGTLKYAVVDNKILALTQRYYPQLSKALVLKKDEPISWAIRRNNDDSFYSTVIEFFGKKHQDGTIAKLVEKYFGHIQQFDYVDTRAFLAAIKTRLAQYKPWFEKYAGDLDWRLLAAISYQESHWKPDARSYTGVRGMMMLTLQTASLVNVHNRLDPEQSIRGGAAYLRRLIKRIPDTIHQDEKVWFALAAYNMGFGHVLDVRRLTKMQGGNPNNWADVKERLPLLMQKRWYRRTHYGYARGSEASHYVNNIRQYYQSLVLLDAQQNWHQSHQIH